MPAFKFLDPLFNPVLSHEFQLGGRGILLLILLSSLRDHEQPILVGTPDPLLILSHLAGLLPGINDLELQYPLDCILEKQLQLVLELDLLPPPPEQPGQGQQHTPKLDAVLVVEGELQLVGEHAEE